MKLVRFSIIFEVTDVKVQHFMVILMFNKKSPRGIRPRRCSPSPRGVKHIKVTQDTIPRPCSERHGEYLSGRAKTGSLGQVTKKKGK